MMRSLRSTPILGFSKSLASPLTIPLFAADRSCDLLIKKLSGLAHPRLAAAVFGRKRSAFVVFRVCACVASPLFPRVERVSEREGGRERERPFSFILEAFYSVPVVKEGRERSCDGSQRGPFVAR